MSKNYRAKILLIDDEETNLQAMKKILELEAYQVLTTDSASKAMQMISSEAFDIIFSDLRMPSISGIELLRSIREKGSNTPFVLLTAYGTVNDAVEAMKLGAVDFLTKPIRRDTLLKIVHQAIQRAPSKQTSGRYELLGESNAIVEMRRNIRLLAPTNASVLLVGESGVGKEVVAQLLHNESSREGKLVSINCGAIPESLLEGELFGYEKGAFTNAVQKKSGLFEVANGGTLFLDEIGDMPTALQVKLLRVLQDGCFYRLGGTESVKVDVRIIAATNADLQKKIQQGLFREDLFYRLNVISFEIPPLRERSEDILLLAQSFFERAKEEYGKKLILSDGAKQALKTHGWPGNIRELKNVIERAVVLSQTDAITEKELRLPLPSVPVTSSGKDSEGQALTQGESVPKEKNLPPLPILQSHLVSSDAPPSLSGVEVPRTISFIVGTSLREVELEMIRQTLVFTKGDKAKAAELLGINLRTIYRKLPELETI